MKRKFQIGRKILTLSMVIILFVNLISENNSMLSYNLEYVYAGEEKNTTKVVESLEEISDDSVEKSVEDTATERIESNDLPEEVAESKESNDFEEATESAESNDLVEEATESTESNDLVEEATESTESNDLENQNQVSGNQVSGNQVSEKQVSNVSNEIKEVLLPYMRGADELSSIQETPTILDGKKTVTIQADNAVAIIVTTDGTDPKKPGELDATNTRITKEITTKIAKGMQTIKAMAVNAAGEQSAIATWYYQIKPPIPTIEASDIVLQTETAVTEHTTPIQTLDDKAIISINNDKNHSLYSLELICALQGGEIKNIQGEVGEANTIFKLPSNMTSGTYNISFAYKNGEISSEDSESVTSIIIDNDEPILTVETNKVNNDGKYEAFDIADPINTSYQFVVKAEDVVAGIKSNEYSLNNKTWYVVPDNGIVDGQEINDIDVKIPYYFRTTDKVGHITAVTKEVTIDTTAPIIKIAGITDGVSYGEDPIMKLQVEESNYTNNTVKIIAERADLNTEKEIFKDYEMEAFISDNIISHYQHTFLDGHYKIQVESKDEAGNIAQSKEISFTVEPPAAPTVKNANGAVVQLNNEENPTIIQNPNTLKIEADKASAIEIVAESLDGTVEKKLMMFGGYDFRKNPSDSDGIVTEDFTQNNYQGIQKITARAINKAGKRSLPTTWYYVIEPPAPEVGENDLAIEKDNAIIESGYVKTKDGDCTLEVKHKELDENYQLVLEYQRIISKNRSRSNRTWSRIEHTSYNTTAKTYQYQLPIDMESGNYNIRLVYQTKGEVDGTPQGQSKKLLIDNQSPNIKVESLKKQSNNSYIIMKDKWTNADIKFVLNGDDFDLSGVEEMEYASHPMPEEEAKIKSNELNWEKVIEFSSVTQEGELLIDLKDLEEHNNTYSFRAIDKMGHVSTEVIVGIKKDTIKPPSITEENIEMPILTKPDGATNLESIYSEDPISIQMKEILETELESNSTVITKYRIDQTTESDRFIEGNIELLMNDIIDIEKEGNYKINIWNEDEAGNKSEEFMVKKVCIDNENPIINQQPEIIKSSGLIHAPLGGITYFARDSVEIVTDVSDMGSGIQSIRYINEGKTVAQKSFQGVKETGEVILSVKNEGTYDLTLEVTDVLGKKTVAKIGEKFIIDSKEPVVTDRNNALSDNWTNQDYDIVFEASNQGAGIKNTVVTLNGKATDKSENAHVETVDISVPITEEVSSSKGYPIHIQVTSNTNRMDQLEGNIFLDKTEPEITLSGIELDSIHNETQALTIGIIEQIYDLADATIVATKELDGRTVEVALPPYQFTGTDSLQTYHFEEDGVYKVEVAAKDKAENVAQEKSIEFTVDQTAPVIVLSGIEDNSFYGESASLQIEITESFFETNDVTLEATQIIDGETNSYHMGNFTSNRKTSTHNHTFSEDGAYEIKVKATDLAGNVAEEQIVEFSIDATPPEVSIEGITNHLITSESQIVTFQIIESFYQTNKIELEIDRTDVTGKVTSLRNGNVPSTQKIVRIVDEFTEEGIYHLTLSSLDEAGNTDETEKVFTIDTSKPIINYMEDYRGKYLQYFQLNYPIDEMIQDFTISDYKMTLNGEVYNGVDQITKEGKYLFHVEATDAVGHSSEAQAEFIIDNTAPEVIFVGLEGETKSYEPIDLHIKLTDKDDEFVSLTINGEIQVMEEGQDNYLQTFAEFGTYEVKVEAIDRAKNVTIIEEVFIYSPKPWYIKLLENEPLLITLIISLAVTTIIGSIAFANARKRKKKIINEKKEG